MTALARKEERESERTCIVTRRREPPEAMIRFVRGPDGVIAPDIRARLPGRGVWVGARAALVAEAARKRMFARSLKEQVETPPQLAEDVDRLLEADCLQMLAIVNKAGAVTAGFNKVADLLAKGQVCLVVEASDGGADGKRKLRQSARRAENGTGQENDGVPPVIGLFTSSQLDLALGRTNVIHAALAPGGPGTSFLSRCRRLATYRGATLDGAPLAAQMRDELPDAGGRPDETVEISGSEAAEDRKLDE
ncbi:RNA-binding protein [Methylocystis sp. MJC1]|uniref:RNA-binding protein n=1 Tax=Methylocystis sp. MJC1 TaxID=2654282 RepID=UPI0013EA2AA4|nr:RNA-binding protein [Methylocystis sp. MJC1]KAF2990526.1 hypothetical protein MJC1_02288 [Methylocystis sp. MJC1]MBU6525811.1 RNA-binding protein [Methylocystis sp. MJC1]UZX12278.1 RNA-binding protein [Methylocystis sp. MJC1]